jgi:hypothetical protein
MGDDRTALEARSGDGARSVLGVGIARLLLAFASLLFVTGALLHGVTIRRTLRAIDEASNLTPFLASSFKILWIADSSTMFILAVDFGTVAAQPRAASRPVVVLLGLVYGIVAALVYSFLGSFFAGHILLVGAAAVLVAGPQLPTPEGTARR